MIKLLINRLRINRIYRKCQKNSLKMDNVLLEFRINQFITLKLIDFGDGIGSTQVYVNGSNFNVSIFSLEEAHELLHGTKTYCCMDEVHRNLLWNNNGIFTKLDSNTMFWISCYYISAWIDYDYDTRLLQMDEAFPILNALYEVGDIKARRVLKTEIVNRILSGYLPVVIYLISMGYLKFFKFEKIIWLFENCLVSVGLRDRSILKTYIFRFLSDTGFHYFFNGNFNKSIKYFKNALKICPYDVETLTWLGEAYQKKGEYAIAKAFLIYVLDLSNSEGTFNKDYITEAWYYLGESNNKLFQFSEAILAYKMAMHLDPDHINAWDQIAAAYEGLGEFDCAANAMKRFKKNKKKMKKFLRKRGVRRFKFKIMDLIKRLCKKDVIE